jgi:beta-mannosidase
MATEFGYHGPACHATLAAAIPSEQMVWDSPMMKLHNKNGNPGQEQTAMRMADDFVPPTDNYDSWHYLAQIMQARALSMGIEWFRALYPWNSGALYWQLNDCYPVSSWSAIDSDGREKPLLHASRRFFAPRLVTIKPKRVTPEGAEIGALSVYLHNDTDEPWTGVCVVRLMTLACNTIQEYRSTVKAGPRTLAKFDLPAEMQNRRDAFLIAEIDSLRGFWWFAPDKELDYPAPALDATLAKDGGNYRLKIKAKSLLRDLCVFPDRLDPKATINDGAVTLIKGDEFTFVIASQKELTLEALTAVPIINCANPFGLLKRHEGL